MMLIEIALQRLIIHPLGRGQEYCTASLGAILLYISSLLFCRPQSPKPAHHIKGTSPSISICLSAIAHDKGIHQQTIALQNIGFVHLGAYLQKVSAEWYDPLQQGGKFVSDCLYRCSLLHE